MAAPARQEPEDSRIDWSALIPEEEWSRYCPVLEDAQREGLRFALMGGLPFSEYSGRMRNTKDVDLCILPRDRHRWIQVAQRHGFEDLFAREPYQRHWIYRGFKDGTILDLIWQMPNCRGEVDEDWVTRGKLVTVRGLDVRILPLEELIWAKAYVMQKERCDWPDLLNVLNEQVDQIDWIRLFGRFERDTDLLGGIVLVFRWLRPDLAHRIPDWAWDKMGMLPPPATFELPDEHRVHLLDTRDWFGPKTLEGD
jgi:hypothetical protein